MTRLLLLCLAMGATACADNAVFELELDLPLARSATTPEFAYVQSRSADTIDFIGDWAGADAPEGFALSPTARTTQHVSFVTSGAAMTRPLGLRVRFCSDRVCGAIADTDAEEAHYVIERAFYRGHVTRYRITPEPLLPAAATPADHMVDRCDVIGCTTGTPTSHCFADGRHFCE